MVDANKFKAAGSAAEKLSHIVSQNNNKLYEILDAKMNEFRHFTAQKAMDCTSQTESMIALISTKKFKDFKKMKPRRIIRLNSVLFRIFKWSEKTKFSKHTESDENFPR